MNVQLNSSHSTMQKLFDLYLLVLPVDATQSAVLPWQFVCPSVTLMDCDHTGLYWNSR